MADQQLVLADRAARTWSLAFHATPRTASPAVKTCRRQVDDYNAHSGNMCVPPTTPETLNGHGGAFVAATGGSLCGACDLRDHFVHGIAGGALQLPPHVRAIDRARDSHRMEMALFELFEYPGYLTLVCPDSRQTNVHAFSNTCTVHTAVYCTAFKSRSTFVRCSAHVVLMSCCCLYRQLKLPPGLHSNKYTCPRVTHFQSA
jgi:hypothetical protein